MCLAVPVRVVQVDGEMATVDLQGNRKQVSIALVSETKAGDYLLLHAGVALQVLDEEEALETLKLLEELAEAQRQIDDSEEGLRQRQTRSGAKTDAEPSQ